MGDLVNLKEQLCCIEDLEMFLMNACGNFQWGAQRWHPEGAVATATASAASLQSSGASCSARGTLCERSKGQGVPGLAMFKTIGASSSVRKERRDCRLDGHNGGLRDVGMAGSASGAE